MPNYPTLNIEKNSIESPHVIILGAGASLSAFPDGDKNGLKLPLMNTLYEVLNLEPTLSKYDLKYCCENFETIYDRLFTSEKYPDLIEEINGIVENYFRKMDIPDEATLYDYLILSLRSKDIIATFNWDPFLAKAYQRNMDAIGFDQMPQMAYLHGNVAIGVCYECRTHGWLYNKCNKCNRTFIASKLLYPISKKNYSTDEFISYEWNKLQHYMQQAYYISIFGYSAPDTDTEAKELMTNAWNNNLTKDFTQIDLIDIKSKEEVYKNWHEFKIRENFVVCNNFFDTYLATHPRRSCDAFGMATLQQNPWEVNPFPQNLSLSDLQEWIQPLVHEEKEGRFSGKPCNFLKEGLNKR